MKQFCVFGNPISHSKSPLIHNFAFESFQEEIGFLGFYGRYLLAEPILLREKFIDLGLFGANITVPFKEAAYEQSDEVCGIAKQIKAVNTIVVQNQKLLGYNTDAEGFYQTILPYHFKSALIIGAGGSAKALAYILRHYGIEVCILNRSKNRLEDFIQAGFVCFESKDFTPKSFEIIINATPAGLKEDTLPLESCLLEKLFKNAKMAYDLIYGIETPFLKLAKKLHLPYKDGKEMLIAQAVLAFELFCNHRVPKEKITEKMRLIL